MASQYAHASVCSFVLGWVVGSLEILGSPASLVRSIGNGVSDFFRLPYEGLTRGPGAFVSGVSRGTTSFVKHISKGNANVQEGFIVIEKSFLKCVHLCPCRHPDIHHQLGNQLSQKHGSAVSG